MGKCVFNETWLDMGEFCSWLEVVPGNRFEARCKLCKRNIKLGTMGVKALESHSKAEKHRLATKGLQRAQAIAPVCSPPQPPPSSSVACPFSRQRTTTSASDLRATFGSNEISKSEVLWILHSITKHLSYNSSSDISGIFQAMFPDSNIAKTFSCGPNKIACIARFGLADFIKRELERFPVNKDVEAENMQEEDTIVTQRLICDYVAMHGGVTEVPLTKELMASVGGARAKYRLFLDQERTRKERESQSHKRKHAEQSLEDLKKRKKSLEEVSTCLAMEADELAEKAEGKAESKMAELISKSNTLRRAYKEKLAQLKTLEAEICAKGDELRYM